MHITNDMIAKHQPCKETFAKHRKLFPHGVNWPEDMEKLSKAGLPFIWVIKKLRLSGCWKMYYASGQIEYELQFQHGQYHDPDPQTPAVRSYYENGQISCECHYQHNQLHDSDPLTPAKRSYFKNGKIRRECHYQHDQPTL